MTPAPRKRWCGRKGTGTWRPEAIDRAASMNIEMRSAIRDYLWMAGVACAGAVGLAFRGGSASLPVLNHVPLLPVTVAAAILGLPLLTTVNRRLIAFRSLAAFDSTALGLVGVLGALLAIPPILLDLTFGFPRDTNLLPPDGVLFYPAIVLVAETVFHLLPLALLALALPRNLSVIWWFAPVVLVEPLFQAALLEGSLLLKWLVLGNVGLVSGAQLWLMGRYGFAAMIGLRLDFYLFWHIICGKIRLPLLF